MKRRGKPDEIEGIQELDGGAFKRLKEDGLADAAMVDAEVLTGQRDPGFLTEMPKQEIILPQVQPQMDEPTKQSTTAAVPEAKPRKAASMLRAFGWFCTPATRADLKLVIADLRRDERSMKKEGRSAAFIKCVVFWRSLASMAGIMWAGAGKALEPISSLLKVLTRGH